MQKIACLSGVLVTPTLELLNTVKNETIAASSLRMQTSRCKNGHFFRSCVPDHCINTIKSKMREDLTLIGNVHDARVLEAMAEILRNKNRFKGETAINEAETRYMMCNPILSAICDAFHYNLRLEESVKHNLQEEDKDEEDSGDYLSYAREMWEGLSMNYEQSMETESKSTKPSGTKSTEPSGTCSRKTKSTEPSGTCSHPRRSIGGTLTRHNRVDYSVYTLSAGSGGSIKIVALIDAKLNLGPHGLAQLIGYYSAFETSTPTPVLALMTQDKIQFVIFPFKKNEQRLVNAVVVDPLDLWNGDIPDLQVLKLILSICREDSLLRNFTIDPDSEGIPKAGQIDKNRVHDIITEKKKIEELASELQKKSRDYNLALHVVSQQQQQLGQKDHQLGQKDHQLGQKDYQLGQQQQQLDQQQQQIEGLKKLVEELESYRRDS